MFFYKLAEFGENVYLAEFEQNLGEFVILGRIQLNSGKKVFLM
jgi:hypothetical protein